MTPKASKNAKSQETPSSGVASPRTSRKSLVGTPKSSKVSEKKNGGKATPSGKQPTKRKPLKSANGAKAVSTTSQHNSHRTIIVLLMSMQPEF